MAFSSCPAKYRIRSEAVYHFLAKDPNALKPKPIILAKSNKCEICGKPRGGLKNISHARCSRIKQQQYRLEKERELLLLSKDT